MFKSMLNTKEKQSTGIVCLLLTCLLVLAGLLPATAQAQPNPVVTVPAVSGTTGTTIAVEITIANAAGMAGGQFELHYDPAVAVVTGVEKGTVLEDFTLIPNLNDATTTGKVIVGWMAAVGTTVNEGVLCRVTLELKSPGTTALEIKALLLNDESGNTIISSAANGALTVNAAGGDTPGGDPPGGDPPGGDTTPPAPGQLEVTVESASGTAGETVELKINIANATGMAGGQFELHYDPAVAVVTGVEKGTVLDGFTLIPNLNNANDGKVIVGWASATATTVTGGGLCRVTLELKSPGTTALKIKALLLNDESGKLITSSAVNGEITVNAAGGDTPGGDPPPGGGGGGGGGGTGGGGGGDTIAPDVVDNTSTNTKNKLLAAKTGETIKHIVAKRDDPPAVDRKTLQKLVENKSKLALEFKIAKVTLTFEPQALLTSELKNAGPDALAAVAATIVSGETGQAAAAFAVSINGQKLRTYHFNVTVRENAKDKKGLKIHNLNGDVAVKLDLSDLDLRRINTGQLVVMHQQPDGNWLERASAFDPKTKTLTFTTGSFSLFTVIEKPVKQKTTIELAINQTTVSVNGNSKTLDAAPYLQAGTNRTMVPVRFVSEMLGAQVEWCGQTNQVEITDNGKQVVLTIDSTKVLVDGTQITVDSVPESKPPGRTFVPLRFISENLGAQVDYNDTTRQIIIVRD